MRVQGGLGPNHGVPDNRKWTVWLKRVTWNSLNKRSVSQSINHNNKFTRRDKTKRDVWNSHKEIPIWFLAPNNLSMEIAHTTMRGYHKLNGFIEPSKQMPEKK